MYPRIYVYTAMHIYILEALGQADTQVRMSESRLKRSLTEDEASEVRTSQQLGQNSQQYPAPPNYPLRDLKYHSMETIRRLIEVHWGV